jgi:hypothetical protein
MQPVFLLGKEIRLLPNDDGELRAADGDQAADPEPVQRYLAKAFGDHLATVRATIGLPLPFALTPPMKRGTGSVIANHPNSSCFVLYMHASVRLCPTNQSFPTLPI